MSNPKNVVFKEYRFTPAAGRSQNLDIGKPASVHFFNVSPTKQRININQNMVLDTLQGTNDGTATQPSQYIPNSQADELDLTPYTVRFQGTSNVPPQNDGVLLVICKYYST